MKKLLIAAAVLYGAWWWLGKHASWDNAFDYAHAHPAAKWAPMTEYYIAMAYYQRGDYPKAQEKLSQLLVDFSTGTYAAPGLLRLSEVATENRDYAAARDALQKFTEEFPNDPSIRVAEQRLEMIKFK